MRCLLLSLAMLNPVETVTVDHADVAEINHFYDEQGRLVFQQLVLWERGPNGETDRCFAWRLVKTPNMRPVYRWDRKAWVATFQDGEVTRRIEATYFRESWTQTGVTGDPELNDRERFPKEQRRGHRCVDSYLHLVTRQMGNQ